MSLCQSSRTSKSRARPAHTLGDHLNALAMSYYLALISPSDSPVYESHFTSSKPHNQIVAASTSTFPSWSSFPGFSSGQQSNQPQGGSVNSSGGAPAPPPKDPFPPQLLGGPGPDKQPPSGSSAQNLNGDSAPQGAQKHVLQMIAYSSLDIIEDVMSGTGSLYLKQIDKFNEWNVSALVVPNGTSF